ncbi:MAG TPA: DUF1858 domain-containing protein [Candidatus Hydrogenedentes bacterium]|jgi:hybrid cluster-associated redox disulfide protein|nr:DUF1858 domain-containing protein [Candidatus Hydrogenedentota bacterium]
MPADTRFTADMSVADAMQVHPRAREVFAAFHLGGCAHCHISAFETIEQVCNAYGVEVNLLLQVLEDLPETEPSEEN